MRLLILFLILACSATPADARGNGRQFRGNFRGRARAQVVVVAPHRQIIVRQAPVRRGGPVRQFLRRLVR